MPSTLRGFVVPGHVSKLSHVNIDRYDEPDIAARTAAWDLYRTAFAEVNTLAAQSHLMTATEFWGVWDDENVQKWLATDDDGALIGLGVQTDDLNAWPLISPAYFERKWPQLYLERRIWYVGFVCTRQEPAAPIDTFAQIIRAMSAETRAAGGVSVMDYCTANVERGLPKAAGRLLGRAGKVKMQAIDSQAFYAYDFGNNGIVDYGTTTTTARDHSA
jgi:hypothetical protein